MAASNQDVLDSCETVVIAVRPVIAQTVLSELHFRSEHRIISVVSGLCLQSLSEMTAPATRITRAVPLPSTSKRIGPTATFPPDKVADDLFAALGTVYPVETEAEFDAMCAATATIASFYAFMGGVSSWLSSNGVPEAKACDYVTRMFLGVMGTAADTPEGSFKSLASAHATAGGINELFLGHLVARGLLASIPEGLSLVTQKINAASGRSCDSSNED